MDEEIKNRFKRALKNQDKEYGGVVVTGNRGDPVFIIYKTWPAEAMLDNKESVVALYFDQDDFNAGKIRNHNDMNREGGRVMNWSGSDLTDIEDGVVDTWRYIDMNYSGFGRSEIDIAPIDKELLENFIQDERVQTAFKAKIDLITDTEVEANSDLDKLKRRCKDIDLNAAIKYEKKLIQEFSLGEPVRVHCGDHESDAYHSWFVTYYFEGFAMHWEYSSGHCNFSISRSTPQMTRQLNTRSAKEWTMGTSPRRFAQDGAYAYYRRFTAKILDKVRDTWRVSLDDEEQLIFCDKTVFLELGVRFSFVYGAM